MCHSCVEDVTAREQLLAFTSYFNWPSCLKASKINGTDANHFIMSLPDCSKPSLAPFKFWSLPVSLHSEYSHAGKNSWYEIFLMYGQFIEALPTVFAWWLAELYAKSIHLAHFLSHPPRLKLSLHPSIISGTFFTTFTVNWERAVLACHTPAQLSRCRNEWK